LQPLADERLVSGDQPFSGAAGELQTASVVDEGKRLRGERAGSMVRRNDGGFLPNPSRAAPEVFSHGRERVESDPFPWADAHGYTIPLRG